LNQTLIFKNRSVQAYKINIVSLVRGYRKPVFLEVADAYAGKNESAKQRGSGQDMAASGLLRHAADITEFRISSGISIFNPESD